MSVYATDEHTARVYPREPLIAQRTEAAQGRPRGWSTLIRRTWHTDDEFAADWIPAVDVERLYAACKQLSEARATAYGYDDMRYMPAIDAVLDAWAILVS